MMKSKMPVNIAIDLAMLIAIALVRDIQLMPSEEGQIIGRECEERV